MTLRVLSYNVRSLRGDRAAVARLVRAAAPDVACIQEAPRFARWRTLAANLAADSGLTVVTGGRPAGAMLLLAALRVEVLARRDVLLTKAPGRHQRGLAMALLRVEGATFAVASMHLDVVADERWRHVGEVLAQLATWRCPVILAGDANDDEGSRVWTALSGGLTDVAAALGRREWTGPGRRLDGVWCSSSFTPIGCSVLTGPDRDRASDHWPLLVELDLAGLGQPG